MEKTYNTSLLLLAVMLYLGNTAYAEKRMDIVSVGNGYAKDDFIHAHGGGAGKEAGTKTICALVFVASVLYILLILLKFT